MKNYLLLAAIVLSAVLPLSSRAVYLDEHIFLHVARSAQTNWLFPQDTPWVFFGTRVPNLAAHTHPPVGEYGLALLYTIFGDFREVPFRLTYSIFAVAAVLSFYSLARRFTQHPFLVTLLFAATPVFFVYLPTLMMDIPMLAFLLAGFASYLGHLEGRRGLLPVAALCFVLAAGTGYTALIPVFCLFLGQIAARRPVPEMLAVCAAPAVLGLWLAAMSLHFGEFPLVRTVGYYAAQGSITRNVVALASFLGGVTVFPWVIGGTRKTIAASVAVAAALSLLAAWSSLAYRGWYIVLASSGVMVLAGFVSRARRLIASGKNHGEAILMLWVLSVLLFFIVVADMINGRYILLAVPPLYLVLFSDTGRRRLIYTLVPTAALSLMLAYADFAFVRLNRDLVEQYVRPLQEQGFRVWSAAESGLRFYLEENGATTLATEDTSAGPGDLIVRHSGLFGYSLSEEIATRLTVLRTFTLDHPFPVRLYSAPAGAGFHDSGAGLVPFVFSRKPYDSVEIAQMSPLTPAAVWSPDGPVFIQSEPEQEFSLTIPSDARIEYELEGDGEVVVVADRIRLTKGKSPVAIWKKFRIVPRYW
jgi:hypothetical protein